MNTLLTLMETTSTIRTAAAATSLHSPVDASPAQLPAADSRTPSDEIAKKIMKLTGNIRLVSRAAHHWHHCGINE